MYAHAIPGGNTWPIMEPILSEKRHIDNIIYNFELLLKYKYLNARNRTNVMVDLNID